jgi:hypothetical protein
VITAVVVEGRSQAEVARAYGVSKGWVSKLIARYRAEGEAAFEPRSRRPKTSPAALGPDTVELIVWVPNIVSPYANWAYSWMRPPSRSRLKTLNVLGGVGQSLPFGGR